MPLQLWTENKALGDSIVATEISNTEEDISPSGRGLPRTSVEVGEELSFVIWILGIFSLFFLLFFNIFLIF